jgi:hypothetical protein
MSETDLRKRVVELWRRGFTEASWGHGSRCNIHTRERPLYGCTCVFGELNAAMGALATTPLADYDQRRHEILLLRAGGAPAASAGTWLSAVTLAEHKGLPVPSWDELERLAPSLPLQSAPVRDV